MSYAVELVRTSKYFGAFAAVDDVSLQIHDGEFFSLLGPSGCGKTTTLRLIAGFEMPTSGEIHIEGKPIGETPPFRRPVNTVFQNYALFPHLNVEQNVAFGLEMRKVTRAEIKQRVAEILELVQMADKARRRPAQLSGGQQQRVALARALVNRPSVLLLDEPLGALDLKLRKEMQLELKQMQNQVGITFIYVTHDQEEALTMSDRIAVMGQGKVLQCATPQEIYEQPRTRYVADFIGETNFLEGKLTAMNGLSEVLIDDTLPVLAAATDTALPVGECVTVAIRPEKINLFKAHSAEVNTNNGSVSVRGVVKDSIYIGTDTRYFVQLTERSQLIARIQNYGPNQRIAKGEEVIVQWDAENARILLN